jgi:hypothetical protein
MPVNPEVLSMNIGTESQVYKLGGRTTSNHQRVWKPALQFTVAMHDLKIIKTPHDLAGHCCRKIFPLKEKEAWHTRCLRAPDEESRPHTDVFVRAMAVRYWDRHCHGFGL